MDGQNKNIILATVLSFLVILAWFFFFPPPEPAPAPVATETAQTATPAEPAAAPVAPDATATGAAAPLKPEAPRIAVDTPSLKGSISLIGGRFDDLSLTKYRETLAKDSPTVRLLSPVGEGSAYYTLYGWIPSGNLTNADVPGADTQWTQVGSGSLTPKTPITLEWDNGKGLVFRTDIAVDDLYMFRLTQSVQNNTGAPVTLAPYGVVARHGLPKDLQNFFVSHEGIVARTDGALEETKYKDATKLPVLPNEGMPAEVRAATKDGWIGFSSKYWMTVLVPEQGKPFSAVTRYAPGADLYQTQTREALFTVAPGASGATTSQLFAGAKEWETLEAYQNQGGIAGFVDAIDWGWFFFLTKPIFRVLHFLHAHIGNMGVSIIALTFLLKALVFPLAYKSYVSMARMKELQPELTAMKERAGDDKQQMQKDMMRLYKEKKVNPAAGCLPIVIQIPIFFSLYKVIFVTLELRQAPFFGWLQDLSVRDPSSTFNLFGLLPWPAPDHGTLLATVFIGLLPILLGCSMWLQQKLNPTPPDATQAMIFAWMPWVFMFMLGNFASGLVLYWITNNTITFTQQFLIMKSHGHTPDIFGNIKASFRRKPSEAKTIAPANNPRKPKK